MAEERKDTGQKGGHSNPSSGLYETEFRDAVEYQARAQMLETQHEVALPPEEADTTVTPGSP